MTAEDTVQERAAALLQARLSWPQADACAQDLANAGLLVVPELAAAVERAEEAEAERSEFLVELDAVQFVLNKTQAGLAAARQQLDQVQQLADNLEAADYGPAIVNKLRAILDAAPAGEAVDE